MLKIRIIPCLDVNNGRVVKGINFLNLVDAGDPVEQATFYSKNGADEITFLDITASSDGREAMLDVINNTAKKCFVPMTVGGGIRTVEDIKKFLMVGADKVSINSSALSNPGIISEGAEKFGTQCIVVAIDAKMNLNKKWDVYSHGGRINTGKDALEWASYVEKKGAGAFKIVARSNQNSRQEPSK